MATHSQSVTHDTVERPVKVTPVPFAGVVARAHAEPSQVTARLTVVVPISSPTAEHEVWLKQLSPIR